MMSKIRTCSFGGTAKSLFLLFVFSVVACTRGSDKLAHKAVVQVNETALSAEEFGGLLANKLKNYDALYAKQESNVQRMKDTIVNEFITSVIMRDYAKKGGLSSPEEEVEDQVKKVRGSYPDDISFRAALAQENISLETWKNSLRQSIYEKLIFQSVAKQVKDPTDEEIGAFYKANKSLFEVPARVRLRQVVLEKEDDAKKVLTRLRQAGGSLERIAKEFSVAPEGKNGGDTGWIEKGALEVFDMAFKMNVGAKSEIIKSSYGFHIFEVLGKKPATQMSLKDATPKIVANLRADKEKQVFQAWLEDQIKSATIKRDEQLISAIQVHTEH
jgi:peptidyl-prolyl cis-trans isomerase C